MTSAIANRWTFFDVLVQKWRYKRVVGLIPKGCTIVDLGCGSGDFLRSIKKVVYYGYGIDKVIKCPNEEKLAFLKGDLNGKIPLNDGIADIVTALAVLEHLDRPDIFIKEICRILKPKGYCILTTPSPKAKKLLEFMAYKLKIISENDIRDHKNYFGEKDILNLFSMFEDIKISYFQFGLNTIITAKK